MRRFILHLLSIGLLVCPAVKPVFAQTADNTQTVEANATTINCTDEVRSVQEVCAPKGWRLSEGAPSYGSVNGRSRIEVTRTTPQCFTVTAIASPLGETCIFGLCNCQGRGWVNGKVTFTGTPDP